MHAQHGYVHGSSRRCGQLWVHSLFSTVKVSLCCCSSSSLIQGRYVNPLDGPADWREKGAILQLAAQMGALENLCIVALARPANIEIKEAVSVVYKSLKKNTVPFFSVVVISGIAHWGNDWYEHAIQSTSTCGKSCLPLKTCDGGLDLRDSFWPLHKNLPNLPEDVTACASGVLSAN